tara:strand:+ start:1541 stop:1786 length:246 start_codon:yes stop_codon:yes gene_type:complete
MGLKFPNPKRKVTKRKVVRTFPVTQAIPFAQAMPMGPRKNIPMQYATPIAYDLGLPTQIPTPIAYAKTKGKNQPLIIASLN